MRFALPSFLNTPASAHQAVLISKMWGVRKIRRIERKGIKISLDSISVNAIMTRIAKSMARVLSQKILELDSTV